MAEILSAFGGVAKLARRLDVPMTTVHAWKRTGRLPAWRRRDIEDAARNDGLPIFESTPAKASGPEGKAA